MDDKNNPELSNPLPGEDKGKTTRPTTALEKTEKARRALAAKRNKLKAGQNFKAAQDHALSISNALSKIKITSNLNESNFPNWSTQIVGNLRSLGLAELMLEDEETEDVGEFSLVEKRCIVEFLFGRMDETNSQRFRAAYEEEVQYPLEIVRPYFLQVPGTSWGVPLAPAPHPPGGARCGTWYLFL
ncbi:hypothetical protein PGT21_022339 [Puccinia graminis f. sp. tritici]|uniref:Uncharacterized protein n=1 Tax=Puccinia graminis f. sp. tritici TaxID=56615 RepID=A0A5B0QBG8_PUCGR|nr:hypothetical protein PGT21_022339 [Puccinia graminis f. sp. tritici]